MTRKVIGTILLGIGVFFSLVLLMYGGPVFPHIIGPSTLAVIGAVLVVFKRKAQ